MLKLKNVCYTCDCYLEKIKDPYSVKDNKVIEKVPIYKCNICKNKVEKNNMTYIDNKPFIKGCENIYGFCNKCFSFKKNDEVHKDFETKEYEILKQLYCMQGCRKCYGKTPWN